jgi:DNA-binding transcriptional MerR regulator
MAEVAELVGLSERTLRRRLATGSLPEPKRDPTNNYRLWTPEEVAVLRQIIQKEKL